jgi:hypothetical protein
MYEWIKEVSNGEIYSDGKRHFLLTWGWATGSEIGAHNFYNTDILAQEWTGGPCAAGTLTGREDFWENFGGFDVAPDGEGGLGWDDYAKKIKAALPTHGGAREGAGRPSVGDKRTSRSIKFSDAEWETARRKANAAGKTISDYVRMKALEA